MALLREESKFEVSPTAEYSFRSCLIGKPNRIPAAMALILQQGTKPAVQPKEDI